MEANDKRLQDLRQLETAEVEQLKSEKQALVDELDASKWVFYHFIILLVDACVVTGDSGYTSSV